MNRSPMPGTWYAANATATIGSGRAPRANGSAGLVNTSPATESGSSVVVPLTAIPAP